MREEKKSDTRDRLLKVAQIMEASDEDHPINSDQILATLKSKYNVESERKAIGQDIAALAANDYDIISCAYKRKGYFLASRLFENWELKVLIDAVSQAKFLTETATNRLVEKLISTASPGGRKSMTISTPYIKGGKTQNKATQSNIDLLLEAIVHGKKVTFTYLSIGPGLKPVARRQGKPYSVTPYCLTWQQDYYYLVCNYDGYDVFSYYRLDRMGDLSISSSEGRDPSTFAGHGWADVMGQFIGNTLRHHGGKEKVILQLKVAQPILDNLHDEFGKGLIQAKECTDQMFHVFIETIENRGLYFLLLQYGPNLEVVGPPSVREKYISLVREVLGKYI